MAKLGDLVAVIGANTKPFNQALNKMQKDMKYQMQGVEKIGKSMSMAISAPLAMLAGKGFKTFADFEMQMAKVQAVSGATADEFQRLEQNAKDLGASTRFSASEVAGLQTEFAKLGFTADEITKVTESTLALAQATDTDLARSAEVAGSTLRAFGLDVNDTERVTDVMAASFSSTALDMESFADAMKYVAPVAASAGISIEETTGMLGSLANAGIKGSAAGTALRRIISELGATGGDVSGAIAGLAAQGLNLADAKDEVGRSAQSALLVLSKSQDQTKELTAAFKDSSGAAKNMAGIMDDTAQGSMARMNSALEAMYISIGEAIAPAVSSLADKVASLASWFAGLSKSTQKSLTVFGAFAAAIGPVLIVISKLYQAFGTVHTVITKGVIPAVMKFGRILMANPYLLVAGAVVALGVAMSDYVHFTDAATSAQESFQATLGQANVEAAKNAATVERLSSVVQDETKSQDERRAALKKLQGIAPDYFGSLDMEAVKMGELKTAVDDYKDSLLRAAKQKVYTAKLEELIGKQEELKNELAEGPGYLDMFLGAMSGTGTASAAMMARLGPEAKALAAEIDMLTEAIAQNEAEMAKNGETSSNHGQSLDDMAAKYESVKNAATGAGDAIRGTNMAQMESRGPSQIDTGVAAPDMLAAYIPPETTTTQEEIADNFDRMSMAGQQFGESMGTAFGALFDNTKNGAEAMKEFGKSVVKSMLGAAKGAAVAAAAQSAASMGPAAAFVLPALTAGALTLVEGLIGAIAFADGGIVSGPTLGLVGEYAGARNNPEVIAPLDKLQGMLNNSGGGSIVPEVKIKGSDLVLVMEKGQKDINRRR